VLSELTVSVTVTNIPRCPATDGAAASVSVTMPPVAASEWTVPIVSAFASWTINVRPRAELADGAVRL